MGRFSSWDKSGWGGGTSQLAGHDLMPTFKEKLTQEQISKPLGNKDETSCFLPTLFNGKVAGSYTLLGKRLQEAETSSAKGGGLSRLSLPRDKSRELLMQHDPMGLALKIPLSWRVASISICIITW